MRGKFLQAGRNHHRKVRIFMTVADADSFVNIAVFQGLRHFRGILPGLLLGFVISQPTLDTDGNHIHRLNNQDNDNADTRPRQFLPDGIDVEH
jgi:hypothetical protein